jgi:hypothetical protein
MKRMRWTLAMAAMLVLCGVTAAFAEMGPGDAEHRSLGFGFHSVEAPVGLRWWFSGQKVGLDLGVGFGSEPAFIDPDEKENHFAIEAGVPFVCHSWDRVHAIIRPGILYQSQEIGFDSDAVAPGVQFDTETTTAFDFKLEGEAEVFLADNVSVSAAHGFRIRSIDPGFGADNQTSFETTGNNFTTVGFHIYLYK